MRYIKPTKEYLCIYSNFLIELSFYLLHKYFQKLLRLCQQTQQILVFIITKYDALVNRTVFGEKQKKQAVWLAFVCTQRGHREPNKEETVRPMRRTSIGQLVSVS